MTVTVTANIGYADAEIPVSADPSTDVVLIDNEQMFVRSHGYPDILVTRGYNNTTKAPHTSGTVVSPVTAAMSTTGGVLVDSLVDAETLQIADAAVTATAAEVNVLHGVTPGTGVASGAVVLDANGQWTMGTTVAPTSVATASNFQSRWTQSTNASGDTRSLYLRHYFNGTGGGEVARFYASVTAAGAAAGDTINALHATCEVETGGAIAGQANGIRATIATGAALAPGGTLAAITAETNFYAGSTLPTTAYLARFVTLGSTVQPATVFSFEGQSSTAIATAGTGANSCALAGGGVAAKAIHVKVDGTDYWLPLFSSNS